MDDMKADSPPTRSRGLVKRWFAIPLWKRILGALIIGLATGLIFGEGAAQVGWIGDIFMRLIRMLVVPLVLVTIASGVARLGDLRRLGSVGGRALLLFCTTAAIAVCVGMGIGLIFEPGVGVNIANATPIALPEAKSTGEQLIGIIPLNPVKALADGDMLGVIFFALMLGIGVLASGESGEKLGSIMHAASDVMLRLVRIVMETAPFGVFGLIAAAIGINGPGVLVHISLLAFCVALGALIQTLMVHSLLIRLVAGLSVTRFFKGIIDAVMVAFSTASSSATLPVAISVAENNLGVRPVITSTVLPLGASIGRDGTALYVGLLAIFSAQVFGLDLQPIDYLLILLTATLAAVGSAPVPSASLFMLAAVLSTLGIQDVQTAMIVGFILPFDRLLDMIRTVPNATTNLSVTTTIASLEREIDLDRFNRPPVE